MKSFLEILWWLVFAGFCASIWILPTWQYLLALILAIALIFISVIRVMED